MPPIPIKSTPATGEGNTHANVAKRRTGPNVPGFRLSPLMGSLYDFKDRFMGNLKKTRRKKIAKHKRRKRLKSMRHKNK
ncbi:MAG: hypothetical protein ACI8W8_000009 [Rhodothermales bacterium]|jgi:hypothetical protein